MNNEEKILQVLTQMQGDISELKQGQAKLEQGQAKLEQGQVKLEQGQVKLEQGQAELQQDVQSVKENVSRIEIEHGQKLDALLDGYKALYDISSAVRSDVELLKGTQDKQDLRLRFIEADKRKTV